MTCLEAKGKLKLSVIRIIQPYKEVNVSLIPTSK